MEGLDYWRICDELTIVQAALLLVSEDPAELQSDVEKKAPALRPPGYEAAKAAFGHALTKNDVSGRLFFMANHDTGSDKLDPVEGRIDVQKSTIEVASLKRWLSNRGFNGGFFFPAKLGFSLDYLDKNHPRYAPKLAAAVRAWRAMDDETIIEGKSVKQAIEKWIREHATELGLADTAGNPIKQAIEECSKVANWNPAGGAPKTPSG